ncbi:MAG: DUF2804 family protein [Desulfobacterales bacterium]
MRNLRFNQFCLFGITGPDVIAGLAVVNLKYLASGFLYVYDRKSDTIIEAGKTALPVGSKKFITSNPANVSCGFTSGALSINIESQRISARSKGMDIDLTFDRAGTAPLRICTKAGYSGWSVHGKVIPHHTLRAHHHGRPADRNRFTIAYGSHGLDRRIHAA